MKSTWKGTVLPDESSRGGLPPPHGADAAAAARAGEAFRDLRGGCHAGGGEDECRWPTFTDILGRKNAAGIPGLGYRTAAAPAPRRDIFRNDHPASSARGHGATSLPRASACSVDAPRKRITDAPTPRSFGQRAEVFFAEKRQRPPPSPCEHRARFGLVRLGPCGARVCRDACCGRPSRPEAAGVAASSLTLI